LAEEVEARDLNFLELDVAAEAAEVAPRQEPQLEMPADKALLVKDIQVEKAVSGEQFRMPPAAEVAQVDLVFKEILQIVQAATVDLA
jgi:hypothetical protein